MSRFSFDPKDTHMGQQLWKLARRLVRVFLADEPQQQVIVNVNPRPSRREWVREAREGRRAA